MNWGKFIGKMLVIFGILGAGLFYAYGNFYLVDAVVVPKGVRVVEWVRDYCHAGFWCGVIGAVLSAIWYWLGDTYDNSNGITTKYYVLLLLTLIGGIAVNFFLVPPTIEGSGLATVFVVAYPVVGYYLCSIFASAEAVEHVPPKVF